MFGMYGRTPLRRLLALQMLTGVNLVDDSVSGNPVTFETDIAKPLRSLLIPFTPVQTGTGDPSPENVRPISGWGGLTVWHTGANLFDGQMEYGNIDNTGTALPPANQNYYRTKNFIPVSPSQGYAVSGMVSSGYSQFYTLEYDGEKNFINETRIQRTKADVITFTTTSETRYLKFFFYYSGGVAESIATSVIMNVGSTPSPYSPYTGQTYPVVFPALGKNLLTSTPYAGQFFNVGAGVDLKKTSTHASFTESGNEITITTDTSWYGCIFATGLLTPGTYNVHTETSDANCRISCYVTDADLITKERKSVTSNNITVTLTEKSRIVVIINNQSTGSVSAQNVQVESGESYTAYEPFNNTIYGGTLDVVSGVLTVTDAKITLNGSEQNETINLYNSGNGFRIYPSGISSDLTMRTGSNQNGKCNVMPTVNVSTGFGARFGINSNSIYLLQCQEAFGNTVDAFKEYLSTHNIELSYSLATPQTYQLTPQQITALVGNNTIWSDTNGDCEITYVKKG